MKLLAKTFVDKDLYFFSMRTNMIEVGKMQCIIFFFFFLHLILIDAELKQPQLG